MSVLKDFQDYRGWHIRHHPAGPVTGQWRAERFGVGMGAGNPEQLKRMIDVRVSEEKPRKV